MYNQKAYILAMALLFLFVISVLVSGILEQLAYAACQ